ncbi:hypothetical protein V0288_16280 [Pannus brasiliensis CCIBt3594]|uniref:DUF3859 domain-containing protein n=1 Tax=Pannus brasiliensis CCIBt3594 TaxID=1427578 RepID=A0AAW9QZU8_9CHRO
MEKRFSPEQLEKVVAEADRLFRRQQTELDTEQVRDILRELNLPPELLEEAMVQTRRREALAARKRRSRWLIGIAVGSIAFLAVSALFLTWNQQQTLERVIAQSDRLTGERDTGGNLTDVSRSIGGEVLFYRVTLANARPGQRLALSCNWSDPSGRIVHQNRYRTKEITTPVWNTFCRYPLGADAPVGRWKVELFLGDRRLDEMTFEVR